MTDYKISYAQNREDRILEAFFPDVKKGFYVDVGANHPVVESVTKIFYQKGWRGINVEPNTSLYDMLCYDRPDDVNLKIGIADKSGELEFTEYNGHGLSTFSKETQQGYEHSTQKFFKDFAKVIDRYKVPVKTLRQVFDENKVADIQFMKVDVEGFEYEVLEGNNWERYRPEVICIEANHITKDWRPRLEAHKYELAFFDGLNNYYVSVEAKQRADNFLYPDRLLLDGLIIAQPVAKDLARMGTTIKLDAVRLARLQASQVHMNVPRGFSRLERIDHALEHRMAKKRVSMTRQVSQNYKEPLKKLDERSVHLLAESYQDNMQYIEAEDSVTLQLRSRVADSTYRTSKKLAHTIVHRLKKRTGQ